MSNKLKNENSPYLLQHSENPVNWYSWSDEAFRIANENDIPIFLSIGYSTCHWCHVMEHECFEDEEVAKILNESFISIKVDREQRPDIDSIYMAVCQMMTQRGGWPLSIFMTPDKKPFFSGTYFPKKSKGGMVGFLELLPRIADVWKNNRNDITKSVDTIVSTLKDVSNPKISANFVSEEDMSEIFESLKDFYDEKHGGFGEAPKFPSPQNIIFLSNFYDFFKNKDALHMINQTLSSIALGGINDHIGGGFHRYSTDVKWQVPHFEKMLYDQANLLESFYESYLVSNKEIYLDSIEKTIHYLKESMLSKSGAFYSAEDADSEGEEGLFYLWEEDELKKILKSDEFEFFKLLYNVETEGNFLEETTKQTNGKNIIFLKNEIESFSEILSLDIDLIKSESIRVKEKLKKIRDKRPKPLLDDKILTDWNSMLISSLSKVSRISNNFDILDLAIECNSFLKKNMVDNYDLLHCYRDGIASIDGMLDDYSFYSKSLIDLYETTLDPDYLLDSFRVCEKMISYFWDNDDGLFFSSKKGIDDLIVRQKNLLDGASPCGNSTALYSIAKLSNYFFDDNLNRISNTLSSKLGELAKKFPINLGMFLANQFLLYKKQTQIVITSRDEKLDLSNEMVNYAVNLKTINKSIFHINSSSQRDKYINFSEKYSFLPQPSEDVKVYVCSNFTCNLPSQNLDELLKILI